MLSLAGIGAYCTLGALQGVLVALPRPPGSDAWARLRSPAWALVLPGSLLVGTFGVLALPSFATVLAVLAAITTPVLAALAVLNFVRGRRVGWFVAVPALGAGLVSHWSLPADLAASILTALGCLTVGAVLVRLSPLKWLAAAIAAMCVVDVVLLATGVGQSSAALMESALSNSRLPEFHQAQLGAVSKDYPDLVLTAVLGSMLAGKAALQRTAAVLVAVLASANGLLFLVADMLPATVPLGVAAAVVFALERRRSRARRPAHRRAVLAPFPARTAAQSSLS
jgi:hypothetical protein